jgi:hypothetical protein
MDIFELRTACFVPSAGNLLKTSLGNRLQMPPSLHVSVHALPTVASPVVRFDDTIRYNLAFRNYGQQQS